jgi:high-affinity iron transporter
VPRLSIIGLFPTLETIAAQILVLVALVLGFAVNRRRVAAD